MKLLFVASVLLGAFAAGAQAQEADSPPKVLTRFTDEQMLAAFPPEAKRQRISGAAKVLCHIAADASAKCEVLEEAPPGKGFGAAAVKLVEDHVKFKAAIKNGRPIAYDDGPNTVPFPIKGVQPPALSDQPTWLRKPTGDQLGGVYPAEAMKKGVSGKAILHCDVNERGTMEKCVVGLEDPPGVGFGAAALLLAPNFILKPAFKNGKPTRSRIAIPVNFVNPGRGAASGGDYITSVALWATAPTWLEVLNANPTRSSAEPVAGHVGLRCRINKDGMLRSCDTINPLPGNRGFQSAALKLAEKFQLIDDAAYRTKMNAVWINFAVSFSDPKTLDAPRTVSQPVWKTMLDPSAAQNLFPARAAEAGLKSGRGVVDCIVAPGGGFNQCKVFSEEPTGMGFGDAALLAVKAMAVNPWSVGGEPLEGAQARIPIVLKLPEDAPGK